MIRNKVGIGEDNLIEMEKLNREFENYFSRENIDLCHQGTEKNKTQSCLKNKWIKKMMGHVRTFIFSIHFFSNDVKT